MQLNPLVRARAARLGADGAAWVDELPGLIGELERRWNITVRAPFDEGTAAYVAMAETRDGAEVVLKLAVPDPDFARQVHTLAQARGRGYVQPLAADPAKYAVLLEALGPSLARSGLVVEQQLAVLGELIPAAWQTPTTALPSEAPHDKAASLSDMVTQLWDQLDPSCSVAVRRRALECAERRSAAFRPDACVVVHGDAAAPNALRCRTPRIGAECGYVFVDPDGFVGDPAYDLGVAVRDWTAELLAGDAGALMAGYCRLLARQTGIDERAILNWGYLERVTTGLHILELGGADGLTYLRVAERLNQ